MDFFLSAMYIILSTFQQDFTLYGFTFSFWDIIILCALSGVVVSFLTKLFN